jgi:hypothetical protein
MTKVNRTEFLAQLFDDQDDLASSDEENTLDSFDIEGHSDEEENESVLRLNLSDSDNEMNDLFVDQPIKPAYSSVEMFCSSNDLNNHSTQISGSTVDMIGSATSLATCFDKPKKKTIPKSITMASVKQKQKKSSAKALDKPKTIKFNNKTQFIGQGKHSQFIWNKKPPSIDFSSNLNDNPFSCSLKPSVIDFVTISDFFFFLINEKMIQNIVDCTNKKMNRKNKKEDPVNYNEVVGFIGLLLLFGSKSQGTIFL